jgi:hypothetical protein
MEEEEEEGEKDNDKNTTRILLLFPIFFLNVKLDRQLIQE